MQAMTKSISSEMLIKSLLEIHAIKINIEQPFTWSSGILSPIYCDNRKILSYPDIRKTVIETFCNLIKHHALKVDIIAGVATGGIGVGVMIAERLDLPFIYVRSKVKTHGLENMVEGVLPKDKHILVIEDLISTGNSAISAVKAILDKENTSKISTVLSIFSYQMSIAKQEAHKQGIQIKSLTNYQVLTKVLLEKQMINEKDSEILFSWLKDPWSWGK